MLRPIRLAENIYGTPAPVNQFCRTTLGFFNLTEYNSGFSFPASWVFMA
jgi:hypothetical protein